MSAKNPDTDGMSYRESIEAGCLYIVRNAEHGPRYGWECPASSPQVALRWYEQTIAPRYIPAGSEWEVLRVIGGGIGGEICETLDPITA